MVFRSVTPVNVHYLALPCDRRWKKGFLPGNQTKKLPGMSFAENFPFLNNRYLKHRVQSTLLGSLDVIKSHHTYREPSEVL